MFLLEILIGLNAVTHPNGVRAVLGIAIIGGNCHIEIAIGVLPAREVLLALLKGLLDREAPSYHDKPIETLALFRDGERREVAGHLEFSLESRIWHRPNPIEQISLPLLPPLEEGCTELR